MKKNTEQITHYLTYIVRYLRATKKLSRILKSKENINDNKGYLE